MKHSSTERTVAIRLRYPETLMDRIDREIERSGLYFNRSDYVSSRARSLIDAYLLLCSAVGTDRPSPNSIALGREGLKEKRDEGRKRFGSYGGRIMGVSVRIPEEVHRRLEAICEITGVFKNVQDALKCAMLCDLRILNDTKLPTWDDIERNRGKIECAYAAGVDANALAAEVRANVGAIIYNFDCSHTALEYRIKCLGPRFNGGSRRGIPKGAPQRQERTAHSYRSDFWHVILISLLRLQMTSAK